MKQRPYLTRNRIEIPEIAPFKVEIWPENDSVILRSPYHRFSFRETALGLEFLCKGEDLDKIIMALTQANRHLKTI